MIAKVIFILTLSLISTIAAPAEDLVDIATPYSGPWYSGTLLLMQAISTSLMELSTMCFSPHKETQIMIQFCFGLTEDQDAPV